MSAPPKPITDRIQAYLGRLRYEELPTESAKLLDEALDALRAGQNEAELLIAAAVPGGDICDPQTVADNIRRFYASPPQTDLDRAWAWFRGNPEAQLLRGGVSHYACIIHHHSGTGPTKDAAVLAAWRASQNKEAQQ